jgi:hypothetical protein
MCDEKLFLIILFLGSAVLTANLEQLHAGPGLLPKVRVTPYAGGHQLNLGSTQLFIPRTDSLQFRPGKDGIALDIYDHEGKLSRSLQVKVLDYNGKIIRPSVGK